MRQLARLLRPGDPQRHFCGVYERSTRAMREEIARGGFADPEWVARWTVAFAEMYLAALDGRRSGRSAQIAQESDHGPDCLPRSILCRLSGA